MRTSFTLLVAALAAGLLASGCAGPEKKFGRGMGNTLEIMRWSEMNRSIEQATLFEGADHGLTTGVARGFNRSLARTGLGLYEMLTAPIPPYGPVWTSYLTPDPAYPDSYKPGMRSMSALATDDRLGFSGGTILPWLPGNRFRIFENN
jgi:putative exosortase-associated protein (TIGR04073 family)